MKYITRHLEEVIIKLSDSFPCNSTNWAQTNRQNYNATYAC